MQQPPRPPMQPGQPPMRQPGQPAPGAGMPPAQPQQPFVPRPPMPPQTPPPAPQAPAPPPIASEPVEEEGGKGGARMVIGGLAAVVLILAALLGMSVASTGVFAPKLGGGPNVWTAVLLNDGEVFFGHMKSISVDRVELTTVYYVQKPASTTSPSASAAAQPVSIVSLVANQVQCPKDDIFINRNNVLYWEDLQDVSYVATRLNSLSQSTPACFQPSASPTAVASATPTH